MGKGKYDRTQSNYRRRRRKLKADKTRKHFEKHPNWYLDTLPPIELPNTNIHRYSLIWLVALILTLFGVLLIGKVGYELIYHSTS